MAKEPRLGEISPHFLKENYPQGSIQFLSARTDNTDQRGGTMRYDRFEKASNLRLKLARFMTVALAVMALDAKHLLFPH